ncbi:sulfatase-like hydrolase/transferase [soil metagenome]
MRTLLVLLVAALGTHAAEPKPNILFVFADDQRFDTIRALGNPEIHTPTLDALATRGMHFTNVYCQGGMTGAVCVPSRTMLLTGKSLWRIPPAAAKAYPDTTLGKTFKDAGYATLCVSKPGNSFRFGHEQFETVVHQGHAGATTSQAAANATIDWLKQSKADKPFFIYLAPSVPHDPRNAEAEFTAKYDPAKLTLSKNFMPRHPFDNGELSIRDEKLAAIPRTEADMKKHLADYYACITGLDHHLGRIVETLKASGRLDNTIIVFSSDQGLAVGGRHGLMGKQNLYEHFKSPLVIAGPGIKPGKSDALVYLFDLYPTLCGLAGVPVPNICEGVNLTGIIHGGTKPSREVLFAAYRDVQRMVRDDRWKLMTYPKIDRVQLFDLKADPDELIDHSTKPEAAETLTRMKEMLVKEQKKWFDPLTRTKSP